MTDREPFLRPNVAKELWVYLASAERERTVWLWSVRNDPRCRSLGITDDEMPFVEIERIAARATREAFERAFVDHTSVYNGTFEKWQFRLNRGLDSGGIALFSRYLAARRTFWAEHAPAAAPRGLASASLAALAEFSQIFHARVGRSSELLLAWAQSVRLREGDRRPGKWGVTEKGCVIRVTGPTSEPPDPIETAFLQEWQKELQGWVLDGTLLKLDATERFYDDASMEPALWTYGFVAPTYSFETDAEQCHYLPGTSLPRDGTQRRVLQAFLEAFPEQKGEPKTEPNDEVNDEPRFRYAHTVLAGVPGSEALCHFAAWLKKEASRPPSKEASSVQERTKYWLEWKRLVDVTVGRAEQWAESSGTGADSLLSH